MTHRGTDAPAGIQRRRVYYIAGFDTRSARHYHASYRDEAARQQAVNGCTYEVGELQAGATHSASWTVRARYADTEVSTVCTFLHWNDIVRAHWPASLWRVARRIPAFYWQYTRQGALTGTWRVSRPFFWMLMLPLLYALVGILAAAGLAALVTAAAAAWGPADHRGIAALALAGAGGVLAGTLALCERQRVFWLMRAWTFILWWGRHEPEVLGRRWDEFARQIDAELAGEAVDEALIIGHSAGAMVAISVAARWLSLAGRPRDGASPKLVTLGNATPTLGLMRDAGWFRREMATVGASAMPWIDYTAPADPLCYALVNAFSACGMTPPARHNFRVKSARFDRMLEPAHYARARRDFFRIHFQYLLATDRPVENDYFSLTAGPRALVVDAGVA